MSQCPACATPVPEAAAFCSACGAAVSSVSRMPTAMAQAPSSDHSSASSGGFASAAAFAPGHVIGGRYRIVGLLGRGGMGEVYRADDLKLGQPVAIKFLPRDLERDARVLERFHAEVRNARQVSHPHVCRVYDIGEVEGRHFLTMEYVDGEDLAALLRRIGSLPAVKAVEIARQLCAGLAAAHDRGVLHRDLKPANIMLDGHGRARITDFGLAVLGDEAKGEVAGTPAYMSPEQLAGEPATVQSDLYSLGLVLYELLAGRRAFEAASLAEWRRVHSEQAPTHPSDHTRDLDPVLERLILRCLEKDPQRRPRSATQVAQALPGADPLAAAVAAGETPSPEMVAAAGGEGSLTPRIAWALLAAIAVLVGAVFAVTPYSTDLGLAPMTRSPEVLEDRARQLVERFGYEGKPADHAAWLERDYPLIRWLADNLPSTQWRNRLREIASPVTLFYRQSPERLIASPELSIVTEDDPPMTLPGMIGVTVDSRARLASFLAVPPRLQKSATIDSSFEWDLLFREADLDSTRFELVDPEWVPAVPFDRRAEWKGTRAEVPEMPLRVSAATFGGKLVAFSILSPKGLSDLVAPVGESLTLRISGWTFGLVVIGTLVIAVVFARRNLRMGRGDRRGATRLAGAAWLIGMLDWALRSHLVGDLPIFVLEQLLPALGATGAGAAILWLVYVAIEPYVRRRMPELLIGWARALEGRIQDSRVARDVLVGIGFGAAVALAYHLVNGAPSWTSLAGQTTVPSFRLAGDRVIQPLATLVAVAGNTLQRGPSLLAIVFALRLLLRRPWLSFLGVWAFVTLLNLGGENALIEVPGAFVIGAIYATATVRFGVLAVAALTFASEILINFPATFDFSLWYVGYSALAILVLVGVTLWAFRTSLGGRPMFGAAALDD